MQTDRCVDVMTQANGPRPLARTPTHIRLNHFVKLNSEFLVSRKINVIIPSRASVSSRSSCLRAMPAVNLCRVRSIGDMTPVFCGAVPLIIDVIRRRLAAGPPGIGRLG